jgi:hypothetical protein
MRPCVITVGLYVSGAPVRMRPGHTHIQTDGNNTRPHTTQTNNERTSTESNLVTAQSTDREPSEDGHT